MRGAALVVACAALLAVGCGSSGGGHKRDGGVDGPVGTGGKGTGGAPGTGGVVGTGGGPGAGGVSGAAGSMGTGGRGAGGALGTGGATSRDAGPARDTDGPTTKLDAEVDRGVSDTRDVAIEAAGVDGATKLDLGSIDTANDTPDSETAAPACAAAGGSCTPRRWEICPAHYEPIGEGTGHLDCPGEGWCCVPAPSSPCSDEGLGNCVVGDACTGCWAPAPNAPACETGRTCCIDNCW